MRTWVAHRRVQQVHGSAAQPQAVDAIGGLFEVGHHATGGHCSPQLRPVVRFPPMLQLDGTRGPIRVSAEPEERTKNTRLKQTNRQTMFTNYNQHFIAIICLIYF